MDSKHSGDEQRVNDESEKRTTQIDNGDDCPVCLQLIVNKVVLNRCNHSFCKVCIVKWCKVKNECPVCRGMFKFGKCNGRIERFDEYDEEHEDDDTAMMQPGVAVLGLHYYMAQRFGRLRVQSHQLNNYIIGRPDGLRRQLYR